MAGLLRVWNGRWGVGAAFSSHFVEVEHVEEVHGTEDEHYESEFGGGVFNAADEVGRFDSAAQEEQDEADVDEVKAHH